MDPRLDALSLVDTRASARPPARGPPAPVLRPSRPPVGAPARIKVGRFVVDLGSDHEDASGTEDDPDEDLLLPDPPVPPAMPDPVPAPRPAAVPDPVPDPVPPPPVPDERGVRQRRAPLTGYTRYDVLSESGVVIGFITYNTGAQSLDAHCLLHAGGKLDCAVLFGKHPPLDGFPKGCGGGVLRQSSRRP